MADKREIIDSFSKLLNDEVRQCVQQDIGFEELKEYHRILIIQSDKRNHLNAVQDLIRNIYHVNEDVNIFVLGQSICEQLPGMFSNRKIQIIRHDARFGPDDIAELKKLKIQYVIDAAMYINNFVSSVDYSNVELAMTAYEKDIPVYSYSYTQCELNRHKEIAAHLYGCILYKNLVEWFGTWQSC